MQAQHNSYPRPDVTDFSSVLKQKASTGKPSVGSQADTRGGTQAFEEYDPYNNRNLSSILSRITDEGPANLQKNGAKKPQNQPSLRSNSGYAQVQDDIYTPSIPKNDSLQLQPSPPSFAFNENSINTDEPVDRNKWGARLQLLTTLIMSVVIMVMGLLLYKLNLQTDELSNALQLKEEQALHASNTQKLPSQVLPEITGLGVALTELKEELQDIKAGQQATYQRLEINESVELTPQLMQKAVTGEAVSALKADFERIQHSTHETGADTRKINPARPSKLQATASDPMEAETVRNTPGHLVVTLASLTSRDKAIAATDRLQRSGVLPLIEEVIVNEEKVYRINVDGFTSRASANAFITDANEKYGFDGGWIRDKQAHILQELH